VTQKRYLLWDFGNTLAKLRSPWTTMALSVVQDEILIATSVPETIQAEFVRGFPWRNPERTHAHIQSADQWWNELMFPNLYRLFGVLQVEKSRFTDLGSAFRQTCVSSAAWDVYPNVRLTLETLSSLGWTHIIVSNHFPELEMLLEGLGLRRHFEQVFTSGIVGFEKPNPKFFEFVLERLEPAQTTWMIGDNHAHDIVGAAQFGIPGILIGKPRAEVKHSCADLKGIPTILALVRAA
jgi:putative hydrolase of the HAD superfamily